MRLWTLLFTMLIPGLTAAQTTFHIGSSRTYRTPCKLLEAVTPAPGDILEVDPGTYTDVCKLTASGTSTAPIFLRGAPGPRPVFDAAGTAVEGQNGIPRAIFEFSGGSYWTVSHLELENAHNTTGSNGAAFRATGGSHDIVIDDVFVHDCQDGIMSDGVATVTVQNSEVAHNGANDGQSHNFYMQGDRTTLIGNHIHDSVGGQNVKLRSRYAELFNNFIEKGGNYEIDLIQGPLTGNPNANAVLIGNIIVRPASADNNSQVILFGTDNSLEAARNGSLYAVNNTFVLNNASNHLFHANQPATGSRIIFENNIVDATVGGTALSSDPGTAAILSGHNNWLSSNVSPSGALTGTLTGAAPGFASSTSFALLGTSPVIDRGLASPVYLDGAGVSHSAIPTLQFAGPLGTNKRQTVGPLDLGAYEYGVETTDPDGGEPLDGGGDGPGDAGHGGTPLDGGGPSDVGAVHACGCSTQPGGGGCALVALLLLNSRITSKRTGKSRS